MKRITILFIAIFIPSLAAAQVASVPISDISQRGSVTLNGGAMVITTDPNWSGASLGATALYNLHQNLSAFVGYDHGFPIKSTDRHLDFWRGVGSLRVNPNAFVGFGYGWFGKDIQGMLAQLTLTKQVMPRVAVGGMYAHVFTRESINDFEYLRVYLNYHLLGKE